MLASYLSLSHPFKVPFIGSPCLSVKVSDFSPAVISRRLGRGKNNNQRGQNLPKFLRCSCVWIPIQSSCSNEKCCATSRNARFVPPSVPPVCLGYPFFSCHHAQFTRLCFGIKFNPGLLQNPRLDFFVMHTQQVKRSHGVMLFSGRAWLVSHELRHHASRYL